ncbi:MAG: hypothetical protein CVV42_16430 [Candidatus Riflebacteria bacterium HGW-Riflebacteria-2]|jgi:hypothetical protein|nr:MAG: hypothetical protein CVV42_16430 [Candidatus Riflebacteria bacterium HGW-Riflebacteria-2]
MRIAGAIIIFALVGALAFYAFNSRAGSVVYAKLSVESLFAAVGLSLDDNLHRDIKTYREIYAAQGFMALYRECYGIALDSNKFDFARQFAAVSTILVISQQEIDSDTLRASAQRLFINFCRLSLVDKISAVQINDLVVAHRLFENNAETVALWNDYLNHVWNREVRPRIRRYGTIDDNDRRFIGLRENFAAEASALLSRHGRSLN